MAACPLVIDPPLGPVLDPPWAHLKARSWVHERARQLDDERLQVNCRADQLAVSREVRVDGTLMNHRGSRFPPSGHRPHAALAPKWRIASAPPEGRAPINRCVHLGSVRPSAYLAISLFLSASLPFLVSLSRHQSAADLFDCPDGAGKV